MRWAAILRLTYKLKGAKTYRVVYGDPSGKDVAAEDLPLPVEK